MVRSTPVSYRVTTKLEPTRHDVAGDVGLENGQWNCRPPALKLLVDRVLANARAAAHRPPGTSKIASSAYRERRSASPRLMASTVSSVVPRITLASATVVAASVR